MWRAVEPCAARARADAGGARSGEVVAVPRAGSAGAVVSLGRRHDRSARVGHAAARRARHERGHAGGARDAARRRLARHRAAQDQAGPRPQ